MRRLLDPPADVPVEGWRLEHEEWLVRQAQKRRLRARVAAVRKASKARRHAERLARLARTGQPMSATCGTCQAAITDATQAWIFEIVGVFSWPMPVGEPVRMSGHIAACGPCHDLIVAGRVGDLVRRGRGGKGTNAGTSEATAMTLALVAQLAAPVRLDAWAEARPPGTPAPGHGP